MGEFFERYSSAYDAFDAEKIASLYRYPCAISDADGVQIFTEKSQLVEKFSANCDGLKKLGYLNSEFVILDQKYLSEIEVAVDVGWRIHTTASNIDFRSLYICHKLDSAWYVFNTNVYQGSFREGT